MKRRSFLKGAAAAGAASLLPASALGSLLSACRKAGHPAAASWNFDEIIDRTGVWSIKRDRAKDGQLAMWIADMDFKTDPAVSAALRERIDRDAMGYTSMPEAFYDAIIGWQQLRNGYTVEREWVGYCPGVITSINQAYLTFSNPGDKIIVQTPVYDPFFNFARRLGRIPVENPLIYEDGRYRMDFEGLERLIDARTKILVLCNPHNPVGILWDRETLVRLAEICDRRGVIVISDEIHSDLPLQRKKHLPFCSVSPTAARVGMIFASPTKSFNIAGLCGTAYCIIPDPEKRKRYIDGLHNAKLAEAPIPSMVATIAAYDHEPVWLEDLLAYIDGNVDAVVDFFEKHDVGIKAVRPQASFLVWLDCRGLQLPQDELLKLFNEKAGVLINNGASYGTGGEGFIRLNVGCPRSVVADALNRILAQLA
ncbi:MAG: pyridoxal phosphate-dependent aminotransferase [Bacteroidales bacterium]|nr:pyridoxal phosphate-dependent aminotransferase [Bacteroidales bacterium]